MSEIRDLLSKLDSIVEGDLTPTNVKHGLNKQQQKVPQMPALFQPRGISVLTNPTDPEHPAKNFFVGGESVEEGVGRYDSTYTIQNPNFNPDDENSPEEIDVGVNYSVQGEYRPATWGYSGGDPAEYPEIEIESVVNLDTGEEISDSQIYDQVHDQIEKDLGDDLQMTRQQLAKKYRGSDVYEEVASEDIISSVKKKLGDYLQDVATAIKKDPTLIDKIPQEKDFVGAAVKTIKTDDGHEIKIHGNEDDGFRISIKNRPSKTSFKTLDEANMAVEMFCNRRKQSLDSADYIEERT